MRPSIAMTIIATLLLTIIGCTAESGSGGGSGPKVDTTMTPDQVRVEAEKMDKPQLEQALEKAKEAKSGIEKQITDALAKLKELSPTDMLSDLGKKLKTEHGGLKTQLDNIVAQIKVYTEELAKKS